MRALVTRVKHASVKVDNKETGKCGFGLLVLSCFTEGDSIKEVDYMVKKVTNLRIFDDGNGVMNKSILDAGGNILSISQFTLYANSSKGNRPSYIKALGGEEAIKLYDLFNKKLNEVVHTETGIFGADMQIESIQDGPINIIIDSK